MKSKEDDTKSVPLRHQAVIHQKTLDYHRLLSNQESLQASHRTGRWSMSVSRLLMGMRLLPHEVVAVKGRNGRMNMKR